MVKETPMKIYKLLIQIISVTLLALSVSYGAEVQTKVSNTHISKGQELKISIIANGENIIFPKVDKIGNYPVQSNSQSQNVSITYTNGKLSKIRQKIMNFSIFPENNITIPSFEIQIDGRKVRTDPLDITVDPGFGSADSRGGYGLSMDISQKKVYTGEPLLLRVVFFEPRNSDIAQAQYIPPRFDGFFVKSSKNERLEQNADGTSHIFDYILTPQKAGVFTIPAPQIKIGIQTFTGANDPWGFFNNEIHWRNIKGNSETVEVKALPQTTDLVGSFDIKASTDKNSTKANKPVNYTLVIEGTGSLEDLDDPKFDIDGVTVYSDEAKIDSHISNGKMHSKWTKKYTFIADKDFTIPAVEKTVFDPKTKKTKTISSKAFAIKVSGGPAPKAAATPVKSPKTPLTKHKSAQDTSQAQNETETAKISKENNRSLLEDVDYYKQKELESAQNKVPWWMLIVSFLAGLIAGAVIIKWMPKTIKIKSEKSSRRHYSIQEALDILYPHTNDSKEIEEMVRQLYRAQKDSSIKIDQQKLQKLIGNIR